MSPLAKVWLLFGGAVTFGLTIALLILAHHFPPPPGSSVAVLAFLAAIMALRREPSDRERAAWIVAAGLLMVLEIWAISHDRKDQDDKFSMVVSGLTAAQQATQTEIQTSERQFNAEMQRSNQILGGIQESINTVTGGDSFAYIVLFWGVDSLHEVAPIGLQQSGKYPLYDVAARIVDLNKFKEETSSHGLPKTFEEVVGNSASTTNVKFGDIGKGQVKVFGKLTFNGLDHQDYNVQFSGQNGLWNQNIRMLWMKNRWLLATRITGAGERVLYERVDPEFPKTNGIVDWTWH